MQRQTPRSKKASRLTLTVFPRLLLGSFAERCSLQESQSELPHLQLALVEAERKRQALQEEIKAGESESNE